MTRRVLMTASLVGKMLAVGLLGGAGSWLATTLSPPKEPVITVGGGSTSRLSERQDANREACIMPLSCASGCVSYSESVAETKLLGAFEGCFIASTGRCGDLQVTEVGDGNTYQARYFDADGQLVAMRTMTDAVGTCPWTYYGFAVDASCRLTDATDFCGATRATREAAERSAQEPQIRDVIEQYRLAMNRRDVAAVAAVFPTADRVGLGRAWNSSSGDGAVLSIEHRGVTIVSLQGETAVVSVDVTATLPRSAAGRETRSVHQTIVLRRRDNSWQIDRLQ